MEPGVCEAVLEQKVLDLGAEGTLPWVQLQN